APQRRATVDGDVAGHAQLGGALLDVGACLGIHAAGVGEHGVHVPALFLQVGHAEAGIQATGKGQEDVAGLVGIAHGLVPWGNRWTAPQATRAAMTAFCTCRRFSASSMAMQLGESITASVALTLRRSGRQWLNTPLLVSAIFCSSTMKCLKRSRMGFSGSQLPKYGSAPQLLA